MNSWQAYIWPSDAKFILTILAIFTTDIYPLPGIYVIYFRVVLTAFEASKDNHKFEKSGMLCYTTPVLERDFVLYTWSLTRQE